MGRQSKDASLPIRVETPFTARFTPSDSSTTKNPIGIITM